MTDERARVVRYLRTAAAQLLWLDLDNLPDAEEADRVVSILDGYADEIEAGKHMEEA